MNPISRLVNLSKVPSVMAQSVRHVGRGRSIATELEVGKEPYYRAPGVLEIKPVVMGTPEAALVEDDSKKTLEEIMNVRFGPDMPTINDDNNGIRDVKNFPRPKRAIWPDETRMYLIPKNWFDAFYPKTGVTGPYLFMGTLGTYLLSKEIYIVEPETLTGIYLGIIFYAGVRMFGKQVWDALTTRVNAEGAEWEHWQKGNIQALEQFKQMVGHNAQHLRNQKILFEAKKENIALQLEAEFRRRQMVAHGEAVRRLNYLEARDNAARAFQQAHMTDWIVRNVESNLAAAEGAILKKCVADLKALSQSKAGAIGI